MTDTLTSENNASVPGEASKEEFDYDSILREYEERETPKPKAESRPTIPDPAVRELLKEFKPIAEVAERQLRSEAEKKERQIVEQAIKSVKEDGDLNNVPDNIVKAYLNLQYTEDPEFKVAFDKRNESPGTWNQALVKARESLTSDLGTMSKPSVQDDTEAALATVKGTSETEIGNELEVKAKDLFAMSDQEFAEFKRNLDS